MNRDLAHVIVFVVVTAALVTLVAMGKLDAKAVFVALAAWFGPSAGASIGNVIADVTKKGGGDPPAPPVLHALLVVFAAGVLSCSSARAPSPFVSDCIASYQRCVVISPSVEAYRACRDDVDRKCLDAGASP